MSESNEVDDEIKSIQKTYDAYTNIKVSVKEDVIKEVTSEEITSIKVLKSETQQSLKNIQATVGKARVEKLINISDDQKRKAFSLKINDQIGKLSTEQESNFIKKMEEWKVPTDVSEANTAVVLKWLDNIK